MDTVYVETTVIGHLTGRLHRDPSISVRQEFARSWWPKAITRYRLVVSQIVHDECGSGDPDAAAERLHEIQTLESLQINAAIEALADQLMAQRAIPPSEPRDALHVAISAFHGVQYLVTWNFKHIANVAAQTRIDRICREVGYLPPLICTPEQLTVDDDEDTNG